MATCNAMKISCEDEKDKKISSKRHSPLDNCDFVNNDTTSESCLVTLENDVVVGPPDSQCNLEPKLSQRKKRKRKRMQIQIPNLLTDNDASINIRVDTSTAKDDSIGKNSWHDSLLEINAKTDTKFVAEPVLMRSKRKKKFNSSGVTNEVNVSLADLPGTEENAVISEELNIHLDTSMAKDDSVEKKSCHDSLVEINAKIDSEFAAEPVLIRSQRKRKKKKFNSSGITNEVKASLADLPGTEENALISEELNIHLDTSMAKDDSVEKKSCRDSLVEINAKIDSEFAAEPVLIRSQRKRKKKKKKFNSSGITNEVNVSLADLPGTEENAPSSEKQSESPRSPSSSIVSTHNGEAALSLVEKDNKTKRKRRRRKKQNASVINDNAHRSHADLDVLGMERNGLLSETQSETKSPSVDVVEKHDNNGDAAFISDGNANIKRNRKRKRKRKIDKKKLKTSVITHVKESYPCSTSCSHQGAACISVEKENTKTNHIEEHNFQQVAHPLVGAPVGYRGKKLLILDLNGLLADIVPHSECRRKADIMMPKKSVFRRPFCDDFLQFCFEKFNVGVWSSRLKMNVDMVVYFLMADYRHKLLFCWDLSHCTETGFTTPGNWRKPLVLKELNKLWGNLVPGLPWNKGDYNESNTVLVDDSPHKALRNPANTAIFPYPYAHKDEGDSSLGPGGDLRVYLEKLAEAQNVQEFIAHNPFGQPAITESNGKWSFYRKIAIQGPHRKCK